jgi:hypothetical protein
MLYGIISRIEMENKADWLISVSFRFVSVRFVRGRARAVRRRETSDGRTDGRRDATRRDATNGGGGARDLSHRLTACALCVSVSVVLVWLFTERGGKREPNQRE